VRWSSRKQKRPSHLHPTRSAGVHGALLQHILPRSFPGCGPLAGCIRPPKCAPTASGPCSASSLAQRSRRASVNPRPDPTANRLRPKVVVCRALLPAMSARMRLVGSGLAHSRCSIRNDRPELVCEPPTCSPAKGESDRQPVHSAPRWKLTSPVTLKSEPKVHGAPAHLEFCPLEMLLGVPAGIK
jgi:hypothetical protein